MIKSVDEQLELPSQRDLDRDIDRPYACIQNPIRCPFHESVDIDHCARMEVYRAVFAIGKHLEKLGMILLIRLHGEFSATKNNLLPEF